MSSMTICKGDVYQINHIHYVVLELTDAHATCGFLLAELDSLGKRLGEPMLLHRMQRKLKGAIYLGRLSVGLDLARYIALRPPSSRPGTHYGKWGLVYEQSGADIAFPSNFFMTQSVTGFPRHCYTLIDLRHTTWFGYIVKNSARLDNNYCIIGYCGEQNIWPIAETYLRR